MMKPKKSQGVLQFALTFVAVMLFALGITRIWIWFNANYAHHEVAYQMGRQHAGDVSSYSPAPDPDKPAEKNYYKTTLAKQTELNFNGTDITGHPELAYRGIPLDEKWVFAGEWPGDQYLGGAGSLESDEEACRRGCGTDDNNAGYNATDKTKPLANTPDYRCHEACHTLFERGVPTPYEDEQRCQDYCDMGGLAACRAQCKYNYSLYDPGYFASVTGDPDMHSFPVVNNYEKYDQMGVCLKACDDLPRVPADDSNPNANKCGAVVEYLNMHCQQLCQDGDCEGLVSLNPAPDSPPDPAAIYYTDSIGACRGIDGGIIDGLEMKDDCKSRFVNNSNPKKNDPDKYDKCVKKKKAECQISCPLGKYNHSCDCFTGCMCSRGLSLPASMNHKDMVDTCGGITEGGEDGKFFKEYRSCCNTIKTGSSPQAYLYEPIVDHNGYNSPNNCCNDRGSTANMMNCEDHKSKGCDDVANVLDGTRAFMPADPFNTNSGGFCKYCNENCHDEEQQGAGDANGAADGLANDLVPDANEANQTFVTGTETSAPALDKFTVCRKACAICQNRCKYDCCMKGSGPSCTAWDQWLKCTDATCPRSYKKIGTVCSKIHSAQQMYGEAEDCDDWYEFCSWGNRNADEMRKTADEMVVEASKTANSAEAYRDKKAMLYNCCRTGSASCNLAGGACATQPPNSAISYADCGAGMISYDLTVKGRTPDFCNEDDTGYIIPAPINSQTQSGCINVVQNSDCPAAEGDRLKSLCTSTAYDEGITQCSTLIGKINNTLGNPDQENTYSCLKWAVETTCVPLRDGQCRGDGGWDYCLGGAVTTDPPCDEGCVHANQVSCLAGYADQYNNCFQCGTVASVNPTEDGISFNNPTASDYLSRCDPNFINPCVPENEKECCASFKINNKATEGCARKIPACNFDLKAAGTPVLHGNVEDKLNALSSCDDLKYLVDGGTDGRGIGGLSDGNLVAMLANLEDLRDAANGGCANLTTKNCCSPENSCSETGLYSMSHEQWSNCITYISPNPNLDSGGNSRGNAVDCSQISDRDALVACIRAQSDCLERTK